MSLEVPISKNNNIQVFSLKFQRYLSACKKTKNYIHNGAKGIEILKVLSSNINSSLDIIRDKAPFEINPVNYNSDIPTENFTFLHVIEVYSKIVEKVTSEVPGFASSKKNTLISDLIGNSLLKNEDQNIIDVYLSKYHNTPKSKEAIYNFIYFIRRLPLIRYLLNHYIYHEVPAIFSLIRDNKLDNVDYLLLHKENKHSDKFEQHHKSGIYRFEKSYYLESLSYYKDKNFNYDPTFENEFFCNITECRKEEHKLFNRMSFLSESTNNIDNMIILFPFLHDLSDLGEIRDHVVRITRRLKTDERLGLVEYLGHYYIHNLEQIKFVILNSPTLLTDDIMNFELGNLIARGDPILYNIICLFCYDLVLQNIEVPNVLEDILILLSIFLINFYGVFKRVKKIIELKTELRELQEVVLQGVVIPGIQLPEVARNNYIITNVVENEPDNKVDFYYEFSCYIYSNKKILTLVEDSLFQLSHLFFISDFLKKNKHPKAGVFFFGALSDEKHKWVKNFNRDENHFLNWALSYYDQIFKGFKTTVIN